MGGNESQQTQFKRELLKTLPSLRAFAISLTGTYDKADDLVQEAVVRAWSRQDSFEIGTNMKAWLFTILRNEFYSQMRKRGREISDAEGTYTAQMAVHPNQLGSLDMKDFMSALNKLAEDQREAIILVCASGFSYEEAAHVCGCAVGTIKSRINRARGRLQELLGINGDGDFGPDPHVAAVLRHSVSA
jgi:RNA polymerase sigma-70 factor (ECF subfamily)